MPQKRRTRLSSAERREQLVSAGLDLARDQPVDRITAELVRERAGVSKALFFHYFPSIERFRVTLVSAVASAVVSQVAAASAELIDTLGRTGRASIEDLAPIIDSYVSAHIDHQGALLPLLRRPSASSDEVRQAIASGRDATWDYSAEVAAAFGVPRTRATRLAVRGGSAMIEEIMLSWLENPEASREELVDTLTRCIAALLREFATTGT